MKFTTSFGWDGRLDVYTGSCGTFECFDSVDDESSDDAEIFVIEASEVGEVYYINFGHYNDSANLPEGKLL